MQIEACLLFSLMQCAKFKFSFFTNFSSFTDKESLGNLVKTKNFTAYVGVCSFFYNVQTELGFEISEIKKKI